MLRFARRGATGAGGGRSEYLGHVDLGGILGSPTATVSHLCWEPRGQRLIVGWRPQLQLAGGERPRAADEPPALSLVSTRTLPSLTASCIAQVKGHGAGCALASLGFAGSSDEGTLVSAGWVDGRVTLLPLVF